MREEDGAGGGRGAAAWNQGLRPCSRDKLAKPLRWFPLKLAVLPVGSINSELAQTLTSMGELFPPAQLSRSPFSLSLARPLAVLSSVRWILPIKALPFHMIRTTYGMFLLYFHSHLTHSCSISSILSSIPLFFSSSLSLSNTSIWTQTRGAFNMAHVVCICL